MGFVNGFRSSGGLCGNNIFLSMVSWTEYGGNPIPAGYLYSSGYTGDMATQANMGGVEIEVAGHTAETDIYTIDVESETNKIQIVLKGQVREQFSDFIYALYKRVYNSDGVTYTDTKFAHSDAQIVLFSNQQGWAAYRTISVYAIFTTITYNGVQYLIAGASESIQIDNVGVRAAWQCFMYPWASFKEDAGNIPEYDDFSPEYGDASDVGGGYNEDAEHGSFDDSSDTIPIPTRPSLSPLSAGYFHAYHLTDPETQLANIGDALFPQDPTTQADIFQAINEIAQMVYYNKQIDYVVDCHVIPCRPETGGFVPVRVGGRVLTREVGGQPVQITAAGVTDGYVEYDCGKIDIKEYWKNFLDFSNGTRAKLFLPFVGYVDVLPEFFNGGELGVVYRFNVVDGSFMAYVTSTSGKSKLKDSMIAQYSGNACMHIPLQAADYSRILSGVVSAVTTVAGASTGNMVVAGAGLVGAYTNLAGARPQMHSSNGYNASASYMSNRTPYLIIERAKSQFSKNYPNEIGLPLNVTRQLSTVHGYTIIENPVLNIDCNDNEYNELVTLLKTGVIF